MKKILCLVLGLMFSTECSYIINIDKTGQILIKESTNPQDSKEKLIDNIDEEFSIGFVTSVKNHLYNHGHLLTEEEYDKCTNDINNFHNLVDNRLEQKKQSMINSQKGTKSYITNSITNEKAECRKRNKVTIYICNSDQCSYVRALLDQAKVEQYSRDRYIVVQPYDNNQNRRKKIKKIPEDQGGFTTVLPQIKIYLKREGNQIWISTVTVN